MPLDFGDDEEGNDEDVNRTEADSEQDFGEIDPFSEGYSTAVEEDESNAVDNILEESLDADFFADSLIKVKELTKSK